MPLLKDEFNSGLIHQTTPTTNEPDEKLNRQNQQGTNPVAHPHKRPRAKGTSVCAPAI